MDVSPSLQDYLEALLDLSADAGRVRTTDLAARLMVSKASVNQAVNLLIQNGLVNRERYGPIYLTDEGIDQARAVRSRHRALRSFFTDILGVDAKIAERDACKIEHVVSAETIQCMLDMLRRRKEG